jgi:hypothetical protein
LAGEETLFKSAAPDLFGQGFESKMKDRAESMKILSTSKAKQTGQQQQQRKFFRGSRPTAPPRGGGQTSRGAPRKWYPKSKTSKHKLVAPKSTSKKIQKEYREHFI